MTTTVDFVTGLPTLGGVRSRLGLFASRTERGELNTLLNDAYEELGLLYSEIARLQKALEGKETGDDR
jgi:hypothetical protein